MQRKSLSDLGLRPLAVLILDGSTSTDYAKQSARPGRILTGGPHRDPSDGTRLEQELNNPRIVRLARRRALLTDPTRKGFRATRLLTAPAGEAVPKKEKRFRMPDRPREDVPRRGMGCLTPLTAEKKTD